MIRSASLAAVLAVLALTACGESAEEQARDDVCTARADIQTEVDELKATPVSELSVEKTTAALQQVQGYLKDIAEAQPELSTERSQEVDAALQAFRTDVSSTLRAAVQAGSGDGVEEALRTAADQLATGFSESFEPVDCG